MGHKDDHGAEQPDALLNSTFGRRRNGTFPGCGRDPHLVEPAERSLLRTAKRLRSEALERNSTISKNLTFSEPSWDILLFLFIRIAESGHCNLSKLADEIGCSHDTTKRWTNILEQEGLVLFWQNANDPGRGSIALSPTGQSAMVRYLRIVCED